MKNRPHPIKDNPDPRTVPFGDLRSAGQQQRLDISPGDTGPDRIRKNRVKRQTVSYTEVYMISHFDITNKN